MLYVKNTDKAAQIKSLMFSNNTSLDLSENFDHSRLIAILEDSVRLARYSFDLQRKKYRRFATYFCEYHALKNIQIRKINAFDPEDSFYTAKLTTRQENFIRSQSSTVHGMIKNMSDKTISDLIAAECGHELQSAAHNLLTVSSKLGTLSRILNEKFVPADKIIKNSATEKAHQG